MNIFKINACCRVTENNVNEYDEQYLKEKHVFFRNSHINIKRYK